MKSNSNISLLMGIILASAGILIGFSPQLFDKENESQTTTTFPNTFSAVEQEIDYGPSNLRPYELEYYDRELNVAYQYIFRRMSRENQLLLKKAQKAWIVFRDADCEIANLIPIDCLIERTDERVQHLHDSYFLDKNDEPIELPDREE